jgi:hypothetical protein
VITRIMRNARLYSRLSAYPYLSQGGISQSLQIVESKPRSRIMGVIMPMKSEDDEKTSNLGSVGYT